jgi:hypothetical protein
MKLVGELKEKVSKAKDRNEAKEIIEKAGILLTDEEMDIVSGGSNNDRNPGDEPPLYRVPWADPEHFR